MGNKKNIWTSQQWEIAREWGKRHGYIGRIGGWIYDPEGNPVAQGWGSLFFYIGEDKMMEWARKAKIVGGAPSPPTSTPL